ncbi:hypothetical protein H072_8117 [Dactylellina haptotyla CBS 200.50]|uniref:RGS domain-containing protein n=1 Tax=Dactylellina haptotyla (strain CBS 200.50) TaxID=1284197 RepID=S8AAK5_DACHA|nr:hypothetical protein H072_8117 [Dactylellina haptotyla CBS 200.50]
MANVDSTVGTVMMSFSWIFYQRPAKGLKPEDKLDYQSSLTSAPGAFTAAGIPPSLSLEKILQNETASPCSIVDLLNYLRFIEHSPEHLEFYLWHEDYVKRFDALTEEEKARSPAWESTKPAVPGKETSSAVSTIRSTSTVSRGSSFDDKDRSSFNSKKPSTIGDEFLSQPFRAEITQIIARYIAPGGARELNISSRDRELAMQALSYTTHPSAVFHLKIDCENYIRHQSHPNFIRWVIANCTEPRMNFAYSLGATLLIFGVLTSLLLTLSSAPRAWRLFGAFFWASGSIMLICAWKGICLVLMAMGHRRLLEPWEIASNDLEDDKASVTNSSFDDVIPDTWDDAPWMIRDKKKPWVRRVFADTVPVEDSEVRWLQDVILIQGLGLAIVSTLPFLAVFMAIPPANLL